MDINNKNYKYLYLKYKHKYSLLKQAYSNDLYTQLGGNPLTSSVPSVAANVQKAFTEKPKLSASPQGKPGPVYENPDKKPRPLATAAPDLYEKV